MRAPLKIFLTGYAGSGKSTAGRKFAQHLGLPFFDLDEIIVQKCKMAVSEVFATKGETFFREMEARELEQMCLSDQSFLLACGGGTPCFGNNMEKMNAAGLTVYLKGNPRFLADRIAQKPKERPLLAGLKGDELIMFVEKHLADRETFYDQAALTLGVPFRDIEKKVEKIKALLA